MSIMDIFAELEKDGWKAGDNADDYSVKDGTYEGIIENLEFRQNEKGTEWFSFTVNLLTENKKYFANLYLTGKMAQFNLKKFVNYIYVLTGEMLTANDFINEIALCNRLKEVIKGKEVLIKLTTKNNFQNFEFEKPAF